MVTTGGKSVKANGYLARVEEQLDRAGVGHVLFDRIAIEQNNAPAPPRKFSDYTITVDEAMPDGVELICKL